MSTAVATRQDSAPAQVRPIDTVRAALERMKPQLAMALPDHLTPDRLLRVALTAVQNTPKLLECDRTSLYAAIMTCAQLGLEPDGVLGQAYLIPYGDKVAFIPGYKGLLSLARNSGDVQSVIAHEVCANDTFGHWDEREGRYLLDLANSEPPTHRLDYTSPRGDVIAFYAIARFKDGGCHWDVLPKPEVDGIRDNSQGYKTAKRFAKQGVINSPWAQHYVEMGKKTAIRRIAKYLPLKVQRAAAMLDAHDRGQVARMERGDVIIDTPAEAAQQVTGPQPSSRLEQFEGGGAPAHDEDGVITETGDGSEQDTPDLVIALTKTKSGATDWRAFQEAIEALLAARPDLVVEIQQANQAALDALAKEDAVRRGTLTERFMSAAELAAAA